MYVAWPPTFALTQVEYSMLPMTAVRSVPLNADVRMRVASSPSVPTRSRRLPTPAGGVPGPVTKFDCVPEAVGVPIRSMPFELSKFAISQPARFASVTTIVAAPAGAAARAAMPSARRKPCRRIRILESSLSEFVGRAGNGREAPGMGRNLGALVADCQGFFLDDLEV
jgi:hypothetical protein